MTVMNRAKHIDTKEHGIFELCDLCEYYDQETNMHEYHGDRRVCLECKEDGR